MAVLQGGEQNLPSPCVCYPKDPMWNRVNICHIEFIIHISKFTTVNILGGIPYQEI